MPPLAQALKKPANIGDMITMPPTPPPAVLPPADQSALGIGATGPSPSIITTPYDSFRQWVRPGVSQTRFPVFPVKANPQAHTTAASGTKQIVNSKGFTSLDKVADGNARLSLHVSHSAPRGGAVGTKPSAVPGGSVAYNFRGVWLPTTQYFKGDEVVYQVSYWMAQKTSLNSTPATGNSNWQVIGSYAAFRGPWSSSVNYVAGDEVTYLGNFWVATTANTNSAPSTSNANWQIAGPNNLDSVQDGTDFGRPPVSQYGPNSPIGKLTGFYLSSNPDFERNLTNYVVYDNNGSGSVALSLIAISSAPSGIAPNGTNQVMKIVETHVGVGPTPGLGGFSYGPTGALSVDTSNALSADSFHIGDTYIIDLLAWIPTGYTLNWASNSLGTGGSFQWLNGALANTYGPSQPGASAWRHYIGRVIIGTSPSASAFPYFYLTGVDGVTWYVGSLHIVDINQTHRHGGIHTLVGSDGTRFGHAHSLNGAGVGSMIRLGAFRYNLNATGHGFDGIPGTEFEAFGNGSFLGRYTGTGPGHQWNDTQASGRQYTFHSGAITAGVGSLRDGTAGADRTYLNSNPQWGFFGTPGTGIGVDTYAQEVRSNFSGDTLILMNDTSVGGRSYSFRSGEVTGSQSIDQDGVSGRTQLTADPRWGFYGSPSVDLETFGTNQRMTGAFSLNFRGNDTRASGREYGFQVGGNAVGWGNISDYTAGAQRTYLNSTPQWGNFGTPSQAQETFGNARVQVTGAGNGAGAGPYFNADDTAVSGVTGQWGTGASAIGQVEHYRAGALIVHNTGSSLWGFFGTPGSAPRATDVQIFGSTGGENSVTATGPSSANTGVGFCCNDTQTSGLNWGFNSGVNVAGAYEITQPNIARRVQMNNTPQWGWYGAPGASVDAFTGGGVQFRNNGASDIRMTVNATGTSQQAYSWSSGFSAAGVFNSIQENVAGRTYLTTTPDWGFYGTPSNAVDIFGQNFKAQSGAGQVNNQATFTGTSGRGYSFTSGGSNAAFYNLVDITANANRQAMDSSGNYDFAGSTPATGVGAGGVEGMDLSGNLILKNKNDAAGSTSNPSTNGTSYTTMAEMTLTFTTKGNKVILIFTGALGLSSSVDTVPGGFVAFFKDGSQLSPDYLIESTQTANGSIAFIFCGSLSFIDSPTAASHTYDVRWKTNSSNDNLKAINTGRRFQAVELG